MPILRSHASVADGAYVTVRIAPTRVDRLRRRRASQPVPTAIDVPALIDTGAEASCIDTTLGNRLNLLPAQIWSANVPMLGGTGYAAYYEVELTLPHPSVTASHLLVVSDLEVVELDLLSYGIEVILGRDVLAHCVLIYDGTANEFTLSY